MFFDVDKIIEERSNNGKALARKFPELKGLKMSEMIAKLPMELDFVTASEMYHALNQSL